MHKVERAVIMAAAGLEARAVGNCTAFPDGQRKMAES